MNAENQIGHSIIQIVHFRSAKDLRRNAIPATGSMLMKAVSASKRAWMGPLLSLRMRLMLLVFIAVTPVIGERIHGLHQLANERMLAAEFAALDLARQAADVQDDLLSSAKTMLKTVSLTDQARRPASEGCSEFA